MSKSVKPYYNYYKDTYPLFFQILTHDILIPFIKNKKVLNNPYRKELFISTAVKKTPLNIQQLIVNDLDLKLTVKFNYK